MKQTVIETPLIGSGSQEEVDNRVSAILHLGTSRGFLTYEELNEKLPDEVVSPDKLDSLLMMIDEMSTKLIDDAVRMYLTQMGEIPLLTREQEINLAKKIEITRKIFRSKVLESDYCLQSAVEILQQVDEGDLPFDRTMKISTAENQADKGTIGQRIPLNLTSVRQMLTRNRDDWDGLREALKKEQDELR